jgi:hypothetical protein
VILYFFKSLHVSLDVAPDSKYKSVLMKAKRTGNLDLPKKVEDELSTWASNNGDIRGDDPDEFTDWIDNHIDDLVPILKIKEEVELSESYSKTMPLKVYADRIGINAKEKQWIMDNDKDEPMYYPNDKFKSSLVLSYPVRTNDYYFAFLTGLDNDRVKIAKEANLKMNILLQQEYKKALVRGGIDFKKEPEKLYAVSGYLWNIMTKAFDKLPRELGAGDTMTRDELYLAIQDLVGEAPRFESYDYQGETIQEGKLTGILGTIANKIRSAKKKIKKRFKLGRKAKDFSDIKENQSPKYDANILKSVADTYASMQNYGLQGDIVEDLQESKAVFSVPNKNKKKIQQALRSKYFKKHPKVKITFGTHSSNHVMVGKGKFVDDNIINFDGSHDDIDDLFQAIQKDKPLMKMMEGSELEEGALADKAKKSGISVGTLRKVYNRGMAAWKTGHRPGTTPQQWGMARVNAFIVKKKKGGLNHDKDLAHVIHPDDDMMNEVKKQEVDAMKKVSKDMQSVLKSYQKIANMGDRELKNTIHNKDYKKVLDARDTILKMIGTLNTKMLMQKENFEIVEASAGAMIDKLFKTGGDKMMQYGIAKLLNMTGVGVAMSMQKQNPVGFKNTMIELGKAKGKVKMPTNNRLLKMFKQQGVKPLPEELDNDDKPVVKKIINKLKGASKKHAKQASDLEKAVNERVKDGKLDPLSKMGKSKLTGSEINQYYRDNPKQKAAARDKSVKKAIELALDLSGATNYAIKEIEKFKKGLSKHPAVKLALRHANESKEFTGHHVVIENLSPANVVKLKTFGKMMAKMTKLPFDENNPEKSIDKLMG